jgi:hypothetical protein
VVVEEMNIMTTVFLRYDNLKIYYPNSVLATKPIMNYYRSPDMGEGIDFSIHVATPVEKLALMKERIVYYGMYQSLSVVLLESDLTGESTIIERANPHHLKENFKKNYRNKHVLKKMQCEGNRYLGSGKAHSCFSAIRSCISSSIHILICCRIYCIEIINNLEVGPKVHSCFSAIPSCIAADFIALS